MIQIVEGKIGSGKTYYAVRHLLKRYYEYDGSTMSWYPVKPHVLVSNISNLKIDHLDLDSLIAEKGLQGVFSEDFTVFLRDGRNVPVVFVIDECQSPHLFHRKFYDSKVFLFFQKSRHFGLDIYLITQDVESVVKEIRCLPEHVIHSVARSLTAGMNFHYKQMSGFECENNFIVKKDQRIFRAYSSFKHAEGEKPRSVLLKYAVYTVVLFVVAVISYKAFIGRFLGAGKVESKKSVSRSLAASPVKDSPSNVVEYSTFKKKGNSPLSSARIVADGPVVSDAAGIPVLTYDDVVTCPRVGLIENDRVLALHQCGETVFTVSDNKIVSSRKLSGPAPVREVASIPHSMVPKIP